MNWLAIVLTFALGFIAGAGAVMLWFCRIYDRIEEKKRQQQIGGLTGNKNSGGD